MRVFRRYFWPALLHIFFGSTIVPVPIRACLEYWAVYQAAAAALSKGSLPMNIAAWVLDLPWPVLWFMAVFGGAGLSWMSKDRIQKALAHISSKLSDITKHPVSIKWTSNISKYTEFEGNRYTHKLSIENRSRSRRFDGITLVITGFGPEPPNIYGIGGQRLTPIYPSGNLWEASLAPKERTDFKILSWTAEELPIVKIECARMDGKEFRTGNHSDYSMQLELRDSAGRVIESIGFKIKINMEVPDLRMDRVMPSA